MVLGGLQKITLIDFPGKIAATVFTSGCSFRCSFCYNPELVLPERIKSHPQIPERDFFKFLEERKGLLEGVVLTGGEPTLHKDLPSFVKKIRKLGYAVKLDTNGSNPEMLERLIKDKIIDYVAMDIKTLLNDQRYNETVGVKVDLDKIKKSIEIIKNSGIDYEFRTTFVPTLHTKEDIVQIARDISPAKKYYLQNFRPEKTIDPDFEKIKPYPQEYLLEIQKAIAPFFETCQVR